jgi:hypothetical protein
VTKRIDKDCCLKHSPGSIKFMWRTGFLLTCFIALSTIGEAQTVTLTLQEDLSSKLPTGTVFTAEDSTRKIYHGRVVTHPARRLLRRGSMRLVFDDPVVPVTNEGVLRAGNKMRLLKLGGSLAAAKLADDAVDGVIGATKARYVAIAVSAVLIIFQKGGEAKLHKGDTIEVSLRRDSLWKLDDPLPYRAVRIERCVAICIPGTLR